MVTVEEGPGIVCITAVQSLEQVAVRKVLTSSCTNRLDATKNLVVKELGGSVVTKTAAHPTSEGNGDGCSKI